ncbi:MAG: 1-acyl-sn-glycerol-3-phosphate acyltransferase [candidate division Zixibacteria bacterium]|nr:1-acyl-sn-glycerol-3-phosphate acyltransferase [candidate division Zixibacteria bacterium]
MRTHYYIACLIIKLILKIFWRFKRIGAEHIPKSGGVIIASNHVAYVDPPFLGAVTPRELFYLAKAELFSNALFGWLIGKYNAIPVSRGAFDRRAITRAVELLKEGKALLLFPEGTRSRDGKFLEPKLGLGKIALEAGVPIVPAYIHNSGDLFTSFLRRKRLVIGFEAPIRRSFLERLPKDKEGYRSIGQEIMKKIGMLKEKIEKQKF